MSVRMRARWKLRQARHWLKCRLAAPAVILMYHRVTELTNDPHLLAVTPKHFVEHLEAIGAHGVPMRLQDLVRSLRQGRVPARAVAITFDDGYADNLHCAKPLLARYEVPATVFLTAGQVGRGREFWWDELDRLLLQPGTLPPVLQLRLNGSMREWRLEEASTYTEAAYQRDRHWHVECRDDPGPRQRIFRALFDLLYLLPSAQRWTILDQVTAWARAAPITRPSHQTLSSEEAARLAEGDLVEIGAHTMTHPVLAALSAREQRQEIQESKARLEATLGHEVVSFAYPHGSSPPEAVASVGEAGFVCACSSDPDVVFRHANRFQLPRLVVRDWDGDTFARWLRWWVGAR
jgi:peptidoglycan/xylan/chitin deacetylase (PgdA/CDA1 family)